MRRRIIIYLQLCILTICIFSCEGSNSTKEEGFKEEFYGNGVLKRKYEVQNNLLHGEDSSFYESGNLKSRFQWYDSMVLNDGYEFFDETSPMLVEQNGDTFIIEYPKIKTYYNFNSHGSNGFEIQFDQNQNPINFSGNAIVSIYQDTINYKFTLHVSRPPYLNSELIMRRNSDYDTMIIRDNLVELDIDAGKCKPTDTMLIYHHIKDQHNNLVNTDLVQLQCVAGKYKMDRQIANSKEM